MNGRTNKGQFVQGCSGNPNGRPKCPEAEELRKALARAKKKKGISLIDHCIERAYEDTGMATAILRKILPDMTRLENDVSGNFEINVINSYKTDGD